MISTKDFSIFQKSTTLKEIGDFPQVSRIDKTYRLGRDNSIDAFENYKGRIPNKKPDLMNCLVLHSKSKLTDVISCSLGPGNDLIVSKKFKSLLEKSRLGPMKFYNVNLIQSKREIGDYFWIHFLYDLMKEVLFDKSKFSLGSETVKRINCYEDYLNFSAKDDPFGFLRAEELCLPDSFKNFDFFMVGGFDQNVYLSKRLAKLLKDQQLTGFKIN